MSGNDIGMRLKDAADMATIFATASVVIATLSLWADSTCSHLYGRTLRGIVSLCIYDKDESKDEDVFAHPYLTTSSPPILSLLPFYVPTLTEIMKEPVKSLARQLGKGGVLTEQKKSINIWEGRTSWQPLLCRSPSVRGVSHLSHSPHCTPVYSHRPCRCRRLLA